MNDDDDILVDSDSEREGAKERRAFLIDFPKISKKASDDDSDAEWTDDDDDVDSYDGVTSSRKLQKLNMNPKQCIAKSSRNDEAADGERKQGTKNEDIKDTTTGSKRSHTDDGDNKKSDNDSDGSCSLTHSSPESDPSSAGDSSMSATKFDYGL
jgi:hypothetical protein